MEAWHAALIELLLFFIVFPLTFKALMSLDIGKMFQKGAIWQMQITVIFISIALSYLVTRGVMNLIELSTKLLSN